MTGPEARAATGALAGRPDVAGWRARSGRLLPLGLLLLTLAVAAFLRLYQLGSWPPFTDESGYTLCAVGALGLDWWEAAQAATRLCYKPPVFLLLQAQLIGPVGDEFVAGRLISALSGVASTGLLYLLGKRLGGQMTGLLAALLYAIAPLAILQERMVLLDGPLTACVLGTTLLTWTAADHSSIWYGLTGFLAGVAAVLFKPPGILLIPMVGAIILASWWAHRQHRPWLSTKALVAVALPLVGPAVAYAALVWGPLGETLAAQNEMLLAPLIALRENWKTLVDTVWTYFPGGLWLVGGIGLAILAVRAPGSALVMLVTLAVWTLPWLTLSKLFPSRYMLPAVPFACVLAALACAEIVRRGRALGAAWLIAPALVTVLVTFSAVQSWQLVTGHATAPMSMFDHVQHRSGMGSGYGYREAARLVRSLAEPGSAVAYAIGWPYNRSLVYEHRPLPSGVTSLGIINNTDPIPPGFPQTLYVVLGEFSPDVPGEPARQFLRRNPGAVELARFYRPQSEAGVSVFRVPAAQTTAAEAPVFLRIHWAEGTWGWDPVVWRGESWSRQSAGRNALRFDAARAGAVQVEGAALSETYPVEVDVLMNWLPITTVRVSSADPVSFGPVSAPVVAGPNSLSFRAHQPGLTEVPDSAWRPVTIQDLIVLQPLSGP